MRRLVTLILCVLSFSVIKASAKDTASIPAQLKKVFHKACPGCIMIQWNMGKPGEKEYYGMAFYYRIDTNIYFGALASDSLYKPIKVWKEIPQDNFPKAVLNYVQTKYKGYDCSWSDEGCGKITEKDIVSYMVTISPQKDTSADKPHSDYRLYFNSKGEFIKKEALLVTPIKL